MKPPKIAWKLIKLPARVLYKLGLGSVMGWLVLLLTTIGRKTGKPRVTPLQYEEVEGNYCVASVRGLKADWIRNIQANPLVEIQVKRRIFQGQAELITDPSRIADFLELRLERHPKIVGRIIRAAGLPPNPTRSQLESYSANRVMVIIHPTNNDHVLIDGKKA
jgi:deazaflavin-dependent oxidoreductase (nitroreductase family)